MNLIIRKAVLADLKNLSVLKQQVWISTYATEGLTEEFSNYVLSEYSLDNIKKSLSNKNKHILIASIDKFMVGCAEICTQPESPISSIDPCIEISTLYILERFQGFRIGKKLLEKCYKLIEDLNYSKIWLTVYFKNEKAIAFYKSQGFKCIGETDFLLGDNAHMNYILLKDIEEGG